MNENNNSPDMSRNNSADALGENDWFDDILKTPEGGKEIEADSHAETMGLSNLADMELEKIIQETLSDDWTSLDDEALLPEIEETLHGDNFEDTFGTGEMLDPAYYTDNGELPPAPKAPETENEDVEIEENATDDPNFVPRKVRPKRKNGYGLFGLPHLVSVAIWVLITVSVGISLGRLVWVCASEVLAFGRVDQKVTVTIVEGDTIDSITQKLYDAGLVKYPSLFKFYAGISNAEKKISAGTFDLNTAYDYHALVGGMSATSSFRQTVEIVIPEGYSCAQIFALLEEKGVCTVAQLEDFAINGTIRERWFLEGITRDNKYCLEGFLSPDTYEFYTNDTPSRVIGKFLDAFGAKMNALTVEPRTQLDNLNTRLSKMMKNRGYSQSYIDSHLLTFRDLITVASMIEKESANTVESYTVASVIYNRLTNKNYPNLQIDATVVYALGGKNDLTKEDLQVDSPYNTYKVEGLPPGPICNPGIYSFYAAFDPDDSSYYYYALDPKTGTHHFSKTYKDHQNFLASIR